MGVIEIQGLGKRYKHYARPGDRLREWLTGGLWKQHSDAWVLRGVSMDIQEGESIALIGSNGAGKSTLLKMVSGTSQPTEGSVHVHGRVAALELGLGFHPDFTGRENVFTAGELFGLRRSTLHEQMSAIEEFAGIGNAIDDPVRTYSSGMAMRLAFSVATVVRPEILIVDEVLAVGDAYFQHKCIQRIRAFREQGTTLLFASHDPAAVRTLCDRAFLLDRGLLIRQGDTADVLDYYNAMIARLREEDEILQSERLEGRSGTTRSGSKEAAIEDVDLLSAGVPTRAFPVGTEMSVRITLVVHQEIPELTVGIAIRDRLGNEAFGTNTHHLGLPERTLSEGSRVIAEISVPMNLGVGNYSLTVALHAGAAHVEGNYDWWDRAVALQVVPAGQPDFVGTAYLPAHATLRVEGESAAADSNEDA